MENSLTDGINETDSPAEARRDVSDRDARNALFAAGEAKDPDALKGYLELCSDYLKRQLIVYENWPQYKLTHVGYSDEKVFRDQNT